MTVSTRRIPTRTCYQGPVETSTPGRGRQVAAAARRASNSRPARVLARSGLIASGVVHILIGVIAINVASGLRARADQSGVLKAVADVPGGAIVLWIAAVSLLGLGMWQWTGPMSPRPQRIVPHKHRDHFKAVAFVAVGCAAILFAVGGQTDSAGTAHTVSAALIRMPGGVFVLAAVGLAVGCAGVAFVVRGVSRSFREDIVPPDGPIGAAVLGLGVVGHLAKGVALLIVALLLVGGALLGDASWTTGLDGAVRYLTTLPTGIWPLLAVALGLIAHGLYLICRTRFMRR